MNTQSLTRALEISHALFDSNSPLNSHFSIAFYKGRVVAIGQNSAKTNPVNIFNPKFNRNGKNFSDSKGVCSELNLFLKLKNRTNIPFDKIEIVNVRINRNRKVALSKPCESCSNLTAYINPKSLYYSLDGGNFCKY